MIIVKCKKCGSQCVHIVHDSNFKCDNCGVEVSLYGISIVEIEGFVIKQIAIEGTAKVVSEKNFKDL